ncbi:MAG: amidohydrolase [Myxococcota bacterium]|nr:amidohydrolase [Myxococcota bacterium]
MRHRPVNPLLHPARATFLAVLALGLAPGASAETVPALPEALVERVVEWRRDFHQNPELSNRETRTAARVAAHLESLGIEIRTGVAHTGVVGVLRGGLPGATVALRADMDALPVTEETGLPFASKVRTTYAGREVGVMHACGHDAHTAILMGAAELLAERRATLPGQVVFLFQPAEEGAPAGERGGARLMIEEGALEDPRPAAVFGLHVVPQYAAGELAYRSGGAMAGSNRLEITVRGRQTHAAYPWMGVDPIAVASRIVLALQAIPGRRMDARLPSIVSFGSIHGGVRHNIIPDEVELLGTIRHLEPSMRDELFERIERTAIKIAESQEALASVSIPDGYPVTYNDPGLTAAMLPSLRAVAGDGLVEGLPRTGAEDFAFFAREIPGLYVWLGIRSPDVAEGDAAPNHSPRFVVDESALPLGVRTLTQLALDFLAQRAMNAP